MPRKPSKKRRKDGRFRVYANGTYFYSTISYADAERQAKEHRKQIEAGLRADFTKITVKEYATRWLPIYKSDVTDKTYADYARLINILVDEYGDYACSAITPDDARAVFARRLKPKKTLKGPGYSGGTIKRARMLYRSMFDAAIENRICTSNPFRSKVAKPTYGVDGTHREITPEEREAILATEHWFKPAVMTMLYAGLRRGEALAVNLDTDLDPSAEWLTVRQAVRFDANQPLITTPKTDAGIRTVPVFPPLRPYLVGKQGLLVKAKYSKSFMSEAAFTSAWDSFILAVECHINGSNRRWYGLTKKDRLNDPARYAEYLSLLEQGKRKEANEFRMTGYKSFTVQPHDLRHSFCTMLRDAGVDMKQTIEWMGHADEKMVLRIYDHPGGRRSTDSVKKVENLLRLGQQLGHDPSCRPETLDT